MEGHEGEPKFIARLERPGLVVMTFRPDSRLTLEDSQAAIATLRELGGEAQRACLLIDTQNVVGTTRDGRRYMNGAEAAQVIIACAGVVGSPLSRVIASFFLGLNQPPYPLKLFTMWEEARAWLEGFLDDVRSKA